VTADYAALEARVTELEHQMRNVLPPKIDAVSYGLSLVHEDLRAFREETRATLGQHGRMLEQYGRQLATIGERLDGQGEQLTEILRRLPAEPEPTA